MPSRVRFGMAVRAGLVTTRAAMTAIPIICGLTGSHPAFAADGNCPSGIAKMRFEDDWECYRELPDPEGIEHLKAIRIAADDWLSIGGEIRQRFEHNAHPNFASDPGDDSGVWLQRYTLHGDLRMGEHFRLFGQLSSALESGRTSGPSPVDRNDLAVQNLFAEFTGHIRSTDTGLRIGRQELDFGSGRLIDVREGPNVRRTFNALRSYSVIGDTRIDAFIARPISPEFGVFDDEPNGAITGWGVYIAHSGDLLPEGALDLYYIGYGEEGSTFAQGTGKETRHSIGTRFFGEGANWDWNWEAVYQFGHFDTKGGRSDISAWTLATETGFTFEGADWQPRLALSANIASGDANADDRALGTFNPMFPRGNYFSEAAVLGPRNFYNLHGFLTITPIDKLSLTADYNAFWRLEKEDGVYGPAGDLLAPGGGDENFVGSAFSLSGEYSVNERLALTAIVSRFFSGAALASDPARSDLQFIELTARYRF